MIRQMLLFWEAEYFPRDYPRLPSMIVWQYWNRGWY